jgi:hypothetical protein
MRLDHLNTCFTSCREVPLHVAHQEKHDDALDSYSQATLHLPLSKRGGDINRSSTGQAHGPGGLDTSLTVTRKGQISY